MPAYQGYQGATTSTPQEIARTRKLAEALMSEATDASPVQHWTQGLARVVKGGVGGYQAGQAGRMEMAGQQAGSESLARALAGGSMEDAASGLMANPYMAQSGMDLAANIIADRNKPGPAPPASIREYEYAKQQGFEGSLIDFETAKRRAGATTVNVGAGETAYDKEMGKRLAEEQIAIQQQGTKAQQAIGDLQVMEQSLEDPNVYTGLGGETVQTAKRAAQFFGVPVEGVPAGEVISRTSKQIALNLKDKLPGPMSNSDRQFLVDLPPGLTTSPEGNRRLIKLGVAQQKWLAERAQVANEIIKRSGGRLTTEAFPILADIDRKWSNTMSGLVGELRSQPQAAQRPPSVGFDALRKRYEGLE